MMTTTRHDVLAGPDRAADLCRHRLNCGVDGAGWGAPLFEPPNPGSDRPWLRLDYPYLGERHPYRREKQPYLAAKHPYLAEKPPYFLERHPLRIEKHPASALDSPAFRRDEGASRRDGPASRGGEGSRGLDRLPPARGPPRAAEPRPRQPKPPVRRGSLNDLKGVSTEDSKGGTPWQSQDSPVPSGSAAGSCW